MQTERLHRSFDRHLPGLLLLCGVVSACDTRGSELIPEPNPDYPGVIEVGELTVMSSADLISATPDWCASQGAPGCYFGQISATDGVTKGGVTFTFKGTGNDVCVIVDPETVAWNHYIGNGSAADTWRYPDESADDGDLDLFGGLSSYYTGSPGIEIGDFTGYYTDSQGRQLTIDYVECANTSPYTGGESHAGRGAPEYCIIDTEGRVGVDYTIVLETFSVPRDDALLSFVAAVVDGRCGQIDPAPGFEDEGGGVTECSIKGEARETTGEIKPCTDALERAYCLNVEGGNAEDGQYPPDRVLSGFCCSNPGVCDDGEAPEGVCDDLDLDLFCTSYPELCGCAG